MQIIKFFFDHAAFILLCRGPDFRIRPHLQRRNHPLCRCLCQLLPCRQNFLFLHRYCCRRDHSSALALRLYRSFLTLIFKRYRHFGFLRFHEGKETGSLDRSDIHDHNIGPEFPACSFCSLFFCFPQKLFNDHLMLSPSRLTVIQYSAPLHCMRSQSDLYNSPLSCA